MQEVDIAKQMRIIQQGVSELIAVEDLEERLKEVQKEGRPLRVKLGLDPSAPDIHLGHTVVLQKMRQFQDLGHEVIIIIGDFTGRVGDPSGRSQTRPQLSEEEIMENAATYKEQIFKVLEPEKTTLRYNSEWLGKLALDEVIELASRYTVARMLERDDFAHRYAENQPIRIHEFFYPLLQAYDSVAIRADVEMGGTDQRFNLLVGRQLQREMGQPPQIVLMMPILEGTDGEEKMSKSLGNYIGVQEPPSEMYGKVMSIPDKLITRYFELATAMGPKEVERIERELDAGDLHPMKAKKRLAGTLVRTYHGEEAACEAAREFERVFAEDSLPKDIPAVELQESDFEDGRIWIVKLLRKAGLVESNSQARRMISQGAVRINGETIETSDLDLEIEEGAVVQVGKRRFARIEK